MRTFIIPFFLLLILLTFGKVQGQNNTEKKDLIQFSGVLVTGDSLKNVPYGNIIIKNSQRGTTSDFYGYFSFVAQESDTIIFSVVGFKKGEFIKFS